MDERNAIVVVKNLYKIFGQNPERAFKLFEEGKEKDEIYKETGLTVGVRDASFEVREGEIFVVMGLSGSGKSTLVRMLNRLIEPTSGHVYLQDKDVAEMSMEELTQLRREKMSMVFQSFALMPHMTVLQNAAFGMEVAGKSEKERNERAMKALEQVGLQANANSYPKELSGGMQQRVGLARGLAVDPTIMLMDEAFSALDPLIRTEMQDELLKLQEASQRTIVFISHDLDEAMRIGDRIAMMEGGNIVQVGTPEEILKNPATDYVKAFFRGVDPTHVLYAGDIASNKFVTLVDHKGEGPRTALDQILRAERDYGFVLDRRKRFQGIVSTDSLKHLIEKGSEQDTSLSDAFLDNVQTVSSSSSLQDALPYISGAAWPVPVVDEDSVYQGAISKNIFLRTLRREED
ncbi:MAG: glycine betaine/L-proline ABC transporter ATP-binding protein ProV [Desulfohalobiaceae bacterium]|nr:glycine betaine/L-proline ABC transporter ATP-binding protein ProV [Desulfohalobiaceae bacterium]